MKRTSYFFTLLCTMALAGCTNEEATLENSNQNAPQGSQAATLTATIGINTRTQVSGTTVKWSSGDSFKAFSADGGYSYGTFVQTGTIGTDGKTATFNCSSMVGEDVSELNYAVYPADYYEISTKVYTFPTSYTYPNSNAPMFGTVSNGKAVFTDLLSGMVRVTLDQAASGALMLTGSGISGTSTMVSVTYTDGNSKKELRTESTESTTVTLSFANATVLDVPVPAGDYTTNNIAVTLQMTGEAGVRTVGTIAEAINAGTIKNMAEVKLSELTSATITVDGSTTLTSDDLSSYTDLTITGTLVADDLDAIHSWAQNTSTSTEKTLDLSNATIAEEDVVFTSCTALTSIVLPEGTTSIAENAFNGCTNLVSVENTSKVTTIENSAFYGCKSLTSIDLSNVTSIGNYAFYKCTSLTSIDLSNVTSIGNYAFGGCTSLESIELSSATSIGEGAFCDCTSLTSVEIPSSVTSIGKYAFKGCTSLTSIEIPSSVTKIESNAFANCSSLATVTCKADITANSDNFASDAFADIHSGAVLYVPNKYLSEYTNLWGSSFTGGVEAIISSGSLTGEITGGYGN